MTLHEMLEEIKKRADAATEGPWKFDVRDFSDYDERELSDTEGECTSSKKSVMKSWDYEGYSSGIRVRPADAQFIANARTDIPKLLRVIERLIEQRNAACEYVDYADPIPEPHEFDTELAKILEGVK